MLTHALGELYCPATGLTEDRWQRGGYEYVRV